MSTILRELKILWKENEGFRILIWTFAVFFSIAFVLLLIEQNYFPRGGEVLPMV